MVAVEVLWHHGLPLPGEIVIKHNGRKSEAILTAAIE